MKLLLDQHITILRNNGLLNRNARERGLEEIDFKPVVQIFCPWFAEKWLLTEIDPHNKDLAFGLCDPRGFNDRAYVGYVRLSELNALRGPSGLRPQCDLRFVPDRTLSQYADEAGIEPRYRQRRLWEADPQRSWREWVKLIRYGIRGLRENGSSYFFRKLARPGKAGGQ